jgi:hypothetical protein
VAIWYDWRNDGDDRGDWEQNLGLVRHAFRAEDSLPFDPKPAWYAARGLMEVLQGFSFSARVPIPEPEVYVLRFRRGSEERFAAWTSDGSVREVELPLPARELRHLDIRGDYKRTLRPHAGRYRFLVDGEPIFLVPSPVVVP